MYLLQTALICVLLLSSSAQETNFVCYRDPECASGVERPVFDVADSFIGCCELPGVLTVSNHSSNECLECGVPNATRVTPRVLALYPPHALVLEISATGYSAITWVVNGTAMHAFSRLSLEDDNKRFILNDTIVEDAGVYEADVHLLNNATVMLDFLVSTYVPPDVMIGLPSEADVVDNKVNITCLAQGNPVPNITTVYCSDLESTSNVHSTITEGSFGLLSMVVSSLEVDVSNATGLQQCYCSAAAFNGQQIEYETASIFLLSSPPTITKFTPSSDKIIIAPNTLELTCTAESRPIPDLQWYKDQTKLSTGDGSEILQYDIGSNVRRLTLTINDTSFDDDGLYECSAGNVYGNTTTSINITVHVPPTVTTPEKIKLVNTNAQQTVTLICRGTGNPEVQLLWLNKGGVLNDNCSGGMLDEAFGEAALDLSDFDHLFVREVMGEAPELSEVRRNCSIDVSIDNSGQPVTISKLTIVDVHLLEPETFVCLGENGVENLLNTSEVVSIKLELDGSPFIQRRPARVENLLEGLDAEYGCTAIDQTDTNITWMRNQQIIQSDTPRIMITSVNISASSLGFTGMAVYSTLVITNVSQEDSGNYTCFAADSEGDYSQHSFNQIVYTLPSATVDPGNSLIVLEGEDVEFSCTGEGIPPPTITWLFFNDTSEAFHPLENSTFSNVKVIDNLPLTPNALASTVQISAIASDQANQFTCDVTNPFGFSDIAINMTVHVSVSIMAAPGDQTVAVSQSAIFTCEATGNPLPSITWTRGGGVSLITGVEAITLTPTSVQSNLTISNAQIGDTGSYYCVASNDIGSPSQSISVNSSVRLTVIAGKPVITLPPRSTEVVVGETISLYCTANALPAATITWLKGNSQITMNDGDNINITTTTSTVTGSLVATTTVLTITNAQLHDAGSYVCLAANIIGNISKEVPVSVFVPPMFGEPASTEVTAVVGTNLTLNCTASGYPAVSISWLYGDSPADNGAVTSTTPTDSDGGTISVTSVFTISGVQVEDTGIYSCVAVNNASSVTREISSVTIVAPPTFLIAPQSSTYTIGGTTTVACTAGGTPTPTITFAGLQCSQEGLTLINGGVKVVCSSTNAAVLTITNVTSTSQLMFQCNASNGVQPDAIATANVSIHVPLGVNIVSSMQILDEGDTLTLVCDTMSKSAPNVTWLFQDALLVQENLEMVTVTNTVLDFYRTRSMLQRTSLIPSDSGEYKCRLEDDSAGNTVLVDSVFVDVIAFNNCATAIANDTSTSSPCVSGNCADLVNDYVCMCNANYTGKNCSIPPKMVQPPNITDEPQDIFAEIFKPINLTCSADGEPIYHWEKDGIRVATISDSVYVISAVRPEDRGRYRCLAENNAGTTASTAALVTIQGVYQYLVSIASVSVPLNSTDFIGNMSDCLVGTPLGQTGVRIYSTQLCNHTDRCFNTKSMAGFVVTLVKLQRPFEVANLVRELSSTLQVLRRKFGVDILSIVRFDGCPMDQHVLSDEHNSVINWPEANIGDKFIKSCPCGALQQQYFNNNATRMCNGTYTFGGYWEAPDTSLCDYNNQNLNITLGLCQITTVADPSRQAIQLASASANAETFQRLDFTIASVIMQNIAASPAIRSDVETQNNYLQSMDNLLRTDQTAITASHVSTGSASRILNSLRVFERSIELPNITVDTRIFNKTGFGISITEVDRSDYQNQTLSISLGETLMNIMSSAGINPLSQQSSSNASIFLPETLLNEVTVNTIGNNRGNVRISYSVFLAGSFFQVDPESTLGKELMEGNRSLGNVILSATVVNADKVENLNDPVVVRFQKPPGLSDNETNSRCVFWDETTTNGFGNWSDNGCRLVSRQEDDIVVCECNHLTHFGYLLAVSPAPPHPASFALEIINYVCTSVSIVCLLITIVTYLITKKLRQRTLGKMIINMCIALIGLYVFALLGGGPLILANRIACAIVGAILHYFMLVYFLWTAVESIDLYRKLVIVLSRQINRYALYGGLVAWGLPLIIVAVFAGAGYMDYLEAQFFCRPINLPFYVGFLVPFGIIYVFNWLLFIIIIVRVCKSDRLKTKSQITNKRKESQGIKRSELKKYFIITLSLSVNFGLGWGIGLLATAELGDAHIFFVYIFSIFAGLQGVLIFLLHCLRVPAARNTWKYWSYIICCCKSRQDAKHYTRSTAPTPFATPYVKRKVPITASIEPLQPSGSMSFDNFFQESQTDGAGFKSMHETNTTFTNETFIPDFPDPYNTQAEQFEPQYAEVEPLKKELDLRDYTYAVVKKPKKSKKKSSTASKHSKKTSRQEPVEEKRGVDVDESIYSGGMMSMESQALEVEFEPESGSEDDEEEWKKLQETLKDIHLDLHNDTELDTTL